MNEAHLDALITTYRDGLLGDTLKFWFPRAVDTEHGGFFTAFERDGSMRGLGGTLMINPG